MNVVSQAGDVARFTRFYSYVIAHAQIFLPIVGLNVNFLPL